MATQVECCDPNAHPHNPRVIETGQSAARGDVIGVEDPDMAASMFEQTSVWCRPNTKAAKEAEKAAKRAPAPETEEA